MAVICPTVTAFTTHEYRTQMEWLEPFAERIHVDFMDGKFAPSQSPKLEQAWWNKAKTVDIHLMYQDPARYLPALLQLRPSLVIVHAEADGDFGLLARQLQVHGIKVGLALLAETHVSKIAAVLADVDHVLVFSGHLGYFGGKTDFSLLSKVAELKSLKPTIEVGWDGGVNADTAGKLAAGGVDVLNVGGYIQNAADAESAYATLVTVVKAV